MNRRNAERDARALIPARCKWCECKLAGRPRADRRCDECAHALRGFNRPANRAYCARYYARNRVAILAKRRAKREVSLKNDLATTNTL